MFVKYFPDTYGMSEVEFNKTLLSFPLDKAVAFLTENPDRIPEVEKLCKTMYDFAISYGINCEELRDSFRKLTSVVINSKSIINANESAAAFEAVFNMLQQGRS